MRILPGRTTIAICIFLLAAGTCAGEDTAKLARQHHQKGKTYFKQGKFEEAEREFKLALDLYRGEDIKTARALYQVPAKSAVSQEPVKPFEYRITPEDALQISVWQNPDLSIGTLVRPDGRISFPLVGDIDVVGKTIPELNRDITKLLKEYIRSPQVFVTITKFGGKKVIMLGEVSGQGVVDITISSTILEAIAKSGGFNTNAVASSVILIRGGLQHPTVRRLDLTRALDYGDLSQNVTLQPEDIIFVPKKFIANLNYFLTQILEPLRTSGSIATEGARWYYHGYAPSALKKQVDAFTGADVILQR